MLAFGEIGSVAILLCGSADVFLQSVLIFLGWGLSMLTRSLWNEAFTRLPVLSYTTEHLIVLHTVVRCMLACSPLLLFVCACVASGVSAFRFKDCSKSELRAAFGTPAPHTHPSVDTCDHPLRKNCFR